MRLTVMALAAVLATGVALTAAQTPTPAVTAHVLVTFGDAAVVNLTTDDFEIWSDDTPVVIRQMTLQPASLSVLLLIDASFSALEWSDREMDSLQAFVPAINAGFVTNLLSSDRLGLGVFGRQIKIGRQFGSDAADVDALESAILQMDQHDRYGPSPIWDAVDAGADLLSAQPGMRAIVLVTDGESTGNKHSLAAVIDHAMQADVSVSVIGRSTYTMRPDVSPNAPSVNLKLMADATGGVFPSRDLTSMSALYARLLNQFHHAYSIEFAPPAQDAGPHHLRVHVKKAGAVAHVRNEYWSAHAS